MGLEQTMLSKLRISDPNPRVADGAISFLRVRARESASSGGRCRCTDAVEHQLN